MGRAVCGILSILMVLLTIACAGMALVTLFAAGKASSESASRNSAEAIRKARPSLTAAEASEEASLHRTGEALGVGCCMVGGIGLPAVIWCAGMLVLGVLYLIFKPRGVLVLPQPPPLHTSQHDPNRDAG